MMTTADMALKMDPIDRAIGERFVKDPAAFGEAFARAWFKLLHRDMGPKSNYAAGDYKDASYTWQDPIPAGAHRVPTKSSKASAALAASGLSVSDMVEVAWASAATFRGSDNRGGANGARIRLAPQRNWAVNNPTLLTKVLPVYEKIAADTGMSVEQYVLNEEY
jgi:catalase-peroxidase